MEDTVSTLLIPGHRLKSLIDFYERKKGKKIWNRFVAHFTSKHGSWLNQAEIALSIFSNGCIGRQRIAEIQTLRSRTDGWKKRMNRKKRKINWRFTTKDTRKKFRYQKTIKGVLIMR